MTAVPHPVPTTRAEALANALFFAQRMAETVVTGAPMGPGQTDTIQAGVWSQIAGLFPEKVLMAIDYGQPVDVRQEFDSRLDRTQVIDPDQTLYLQRAETVLDSAATTQGLNGTATVDSRVYVALMVLVKRYMHGQSRQAGSVVQVDLDLDEGEYDSLEFTQDGAILRVYLKPA